MRPDSIELFFLCIHLHVPRLDVVKFDRLLFAEKGGEAMVRGSDPSRLGDQATHDTA